VGERACLQHPLRDAYWCTLKPAPSRHLLLTALRFSFWHGLSSQGSKVRILGAAVLYRCCTTLRSIPGCPRPGVSIKEADTFARSADGDGNAFDDSRQGFSPALTLAPRRRLRAVTAVLSRRAGRSGPGGHSRLGPGQAASRPGNAVRGAGRDEPDERESDAEACREPCGE
jgi:hypothetical protein